MMHFPRSILALAILLALFSPSLHAEETHEIRIGSILILTGQGASWGIAARNGVDLAVSDLNAAGGILGKQVVAIHENDEGDPKKGVSAFRKLTDLDRVKFIIGPTWSNVGLALTDLAARERVIMISPSLGMPEFNEANQLLFNTWPHDHLLARQLGDYVYSKGHRRVALVGAEDIWVKVQTEAFRGRYEELGGVIAYFAEPLRSATDLRTEALRIKNTPNVDAFISTTDGVIVGSLVAKSLRELGVALPCYSITLDQEAIDAAGDGFEGLEFLTSLTPQPEFKKRYEERFGSEIDIGADSAYDAVMMLAQAIRDVQSTDVKEVAGKLGEIRRYEGVSGVLQSDGRRAFTKKHGVRRVIRGRPSDV